jgi:hypothetical protein
MFAKILTVFAILAVLAAPVSSFAGSSDVLDSSYWSKLVHEENSLVASMLFIPYLLGQVPVRIIDAIVNPRPTTYATVPPAAHKVPAQ